MATAIPSNNARFTLGELARACGGRLVGGSLEQQVHGVTIDSRAVRPGALFVALRGEHFDGHDFVAQATSAGAAAVLIDNAAESCDGLTAVVVGDSHRALGDLATAHRRDWRGTLVGVTGSVGKTTTKELVAGALAATGRRVLRSAGNLNNQVGLPMSLLCLNPSVDTAVVELGSSAPGEIARLSELAAPDVGLVTSVALAHSAGLGSLGAIAIEKAALLHELNAEGLAVYNADSGALAQALGGLKARRSLTFGESESADVRLVCCGPAEAGEPPGMLRWRCEYSVQGERLEARLRALGRAAATDAAAALAVALGCAGRTKLDDAVSGIEAVHPVPGRLMPRATGRGVLVLDDTYNANPASCLLALETAAQLAHARAGRLMVVLGDMAELGSRAQCEHEKLGRSVVQARAVLFVARGELMRAAARSAIEQAGKTGEDCLVEHVSGANAASQVLTGRKPGSNDVVLIKGSRSMAMEQVADALVNEWGAISAGGLQ